MGFINQNKAYRYKVYPACSAPLKKRFQDSRHTNDVIEVGYNIAPCLKMFGGEFDRSANVASMHFASTNKIFYVGCVMHVFCVMPLLCYRDSLWR